MSIALRANDGTEIPLSDAQRVDLRQTIGAAAKPVVLTAQEIDDPSADVLADVDADYRSDAAPFTRYRSDGKQLRAQADEGHRHRQDDVDGLSPLLTQLATDNAAALTASSEALIDAKNAADDANAAQAVASQASETAAGAVLAAQAATSAASVAQRSSDSAMLAATAAQKQVDTLVGEVSAATQVAADALDVAKQAQTDVAAVAGVSFVVVGAVGLTTQARQLAPGSRIRLSDGGPGQTLQIESRADVATQFTAGQAVAFIDLQIEPPESRVRWDARQSNNARLTLAADAVLAFPKGLMDGQALTLKVRQAPPGGFNLTFDHGYRWPSGQVPAIGSGAGEVTMLRFRYDQSDNMLASQIDAIYA